MKKLVVLLVILVLLVLAAVAVGLFALRWRPLAGGPAVLALRIDGPLYDRSPLPALPFVRPRPEHSLASLSRILRRARADEDLRGVALRIDAARFGLGKAQELRDLLGSVRAAGKFVDCYMSTAGEGTNGTLAYYLSTACDHLALAPVGELNLLGLFADAAFVRGALDKLKIEPDFAHVGAYKSAAETYTEYAHSPAAEEALAALLDDLYEQIVDAIAARRGLAPERVRELVDRAPLGSEEALAAGLVDAVGYPDEFDDRVLAAAGPGARFVGASDYLLSLPSPGGRRLAVVFAQGTILRGRSGMDPWSGDPFVGDETLAEVLRPLADRSAVAAVVLRIDSPGGSPVASDLILREVERLAEQKPVIVSMSDLAASGGYYIAAKAHTILADPATLTGSIGVVGGKLVTGRFQEELLGISHDPLMRGANADFYSSLTPFSPLQEERFRQQMERIYERFVGHVAHGRGLTREEVEAVAGGRVWTGRQALDQGLVDRLGGLEEALEAAREAAGLPADPPPTVEYLPRPPGLLDLLSGDLSPLAAGWRNRLIDALAPQPRRLLELPHELARLGRGAQ